MPRVVANLALVRGPVLLEQRVRIGVRRRRRVRLVEQVLDADQDLLDRDRRPPAFVFVEDRQAHRAGRVYVGVEEWWDEFACARGRALWLVSRCDEKG